MLTGPATEPTTSMIMIRGMTLCGWAFWFGKKLTYGFTDSVESDITYWLIERDSLSIKAIKKPTSSFTWEWEH